MDLSGKNLTEVDFTNAILRGGSLLGATLTRVVWSNTTCPDGSKTSSGCSNTALPIEPPADFDFRSKTWYDSVPILRGTEGAPLMGQTLLEEGEYSDPFHGYPIADDGIKGMINNRSGEAVLIRSDWSADIQPGNHWKYSQVILQAGDAVPYVLFMQGIFEFYRFTDGKAVGEPFKLRIIDQYVGYPITEFTPPGASSPANVRTGWEENDYHQEIWGSIDLGVARGNDGWKVPTTKPYRDHYPDPNWSETSDYAIFTVNINHL